MSEALLLACSALVSRVVSLIGLFRGPSTPARILVVKLDHFGDVILATPALRTLRESHPDAEIDALVSPDSRPALEGNPSVTRVLEYDSPRYRRAGGDAPPQAGEGAPTAAPGALAALRRVTRRKYDLILELRGDGRTLLLPLWTGPRRRVDRGSVLLRDWIGRRLPPNRARPRPPLHEVEVNLEVVGPLLRGPASTPGRAPPPVRVEFFEPPAAHESMRRKLAALGLDPGSPVVCIHPGAFWEPRAWRPERFAAVADWIQEHYDAPVAVLGSAVERDAVAAVRARVRGSRAFYLGGALTLPEVAALFRNAKLLIDNDTGLGHLAAACGLPAVHLFGPTLPERFRPWSQRSVVLHHRLHCCPCRQTICVHPENPCVNRIDIEEVKEQVRQILGPGPIR